MKFLFNQCSLVEFILNDINIAANISILSQQAALGAHLTGRASSSAWNDHSCVHKKRLDRYGAWRPQQFRHHCVYSSLMSPIASARALSPDICM